MIFSAPQRQDVAQEFTWNLERIYITSHDWEQDAHQLAILLPQLVALRGTLSHDAASLLRALRLRDQIGMKMEKLVVFAKLCYDEDRTNAASQILYDQATSLKTKVATTTAFFIPEVLAIDELRLQEFMSTDTELRVYAHYVDALVHQKRHRCSEDEELLLAQVGEILATPRRLFERINVFPQSIHDSTGKEYPSGLYAEHPDRELRHQAFKAFYMAYGEQQKVYAEALFSHMKTRQFLAQIRGYSSVVEMVLSEQYLPIQVYDNVLTVMQHNRKLYQRYLRLRKRLLGLHELHVYDLTVPLVPQGNLIIPFDEAKGMITRSFNMMGDEYLQVVLTLLNDRYLDVAVNTGKVYGSYGGAIYGSSPFALLSYRQHLSDVYTLAHEVGHAVHASIAQRHQPFVYANLSTPSGFLAEIAANVHEMLLTRYLLNTMTEKTARLAVLSRVLDAYQTAFFVPMLYAEFEQTIYHATEEGAFLTAEYFNATFKETMQQQYGSEVVVDEVASLRWCSSALLYETFYAYQYATGVSAAAALVQQMLNEGQPAVDRYHTYQRAGLSDYGLNTLKKAGVDMSISAPIQQALVLFESYLDEVEKLL